MASPKLRTQTGPISRSVGGAFPVYKPTDTVTGDVLVVAISTAQAPVLTPPAGWTTLRNNFLGVFIRRCDGTEATSFPFRTYSNCTWWCGRFDGVHATTLLDATTAAPATGAGSNQSVPQVTTATVDALIVTVLGGMSNTSIATADTIASPYTRTFTSATGGVSLTVATDEQPAAGLSAAANWTARGSGNYAKVTLALRAGVAVADPPADTLTVPTPTVAVVAGQAEFGLASHHQINVTGAAATGGTAPYSYQLQRSDDLSGVAIAWNNVGPAATTATFRDKGVDPATKYHYRIRASATGGTRGTSASGSATTTIPDIPGYALWWSRMLADLVAGLPRMRSTTSYTDDVANHDGTYGARQALLMRPGDPQLLEALDQHFRCYVDLYVTPNSGGVSGYRLFPEGYALRWELDGHVPSRDALAALKARGLYVNSSSGPLTAENVARECSYALLTQTEADRSGVTAWNEARVANLVDWALTNVAHWVGDSRTWRATNSGIQGFFMGIAGIALSKYLDHIEANKARTDARIVPALAALAFKLRDRYWRVASGDFVWPIGPDGGWSKDYVIGQTQGSSDNLNLETTNFFAWVYHRTGNDYFKTAGDEAFAAGIDTTGITKPKEWNQAFRWSFDYVKLRQATKLADNSFYVVDQPIVSIGAAGRPGSTFRVLPMKSFTGTITPSDGAGGTFTPASLSWSNAGDVKSFTYTPSTAGEKTITYASTGGLTNQASQAYTATPPVPAPAAAASATFVASDATTKGDWIGVYGGDGYALPGSPSDVASLPSYVTLIPGVDAVAGAAAVTGAKALQIPPTGATRLASSWTDLYHVTFAVCLGDATPRKLTVHALDDSPGATRLQRVDILDEATGALLDSRNLANFQEGAYLTWTITGNVRVFAKRTLTYTLGNVDPPNRATLDGLFFDSDEPPPAALAAGVASFVSSGPAGIAASATPASGGIGAVSRRWQRSAGGAPYVALSDDSPPVDSSDEEGVAGSTSDELFDGSAVAGTLYRYRVTDTDSDTPPTTVTSNAVSAQVYGGGPLTASEGTSVKFVVLRQAP